MYISRRDSSEFLLYEKRTPLVLDGARQVGKTYILKEFGNKEYKTLSYVNLDIDAVAKPIFAPKAYRFQSRENKERGSGHHKVILHPRDGSILEDAAGNIRITRTAWRALMASMSSISKEFRLQK